MDKKELATLIRKIEAMQAAMAIMQREMTEIASRLRFIPVSEASSSSDDEVNDEYTAGMKR